MEPIRHILICGGGLAGAMAAAAVSRSVPPGIRVTLADIVDDRDGDLFYGTVTGPSAYGFNLGAGVEEPALVLGSDTAFSWGTRYQDWGGCDWIQCFALAFPVVEGVQLHHYLVAAGEQAIEPYCVAAGAARRGGFAHPPRGPGETHPLSRADYGYQFDPAAYAALFARVATVERIDGVLDDVETGAAGIEGLRLTDGRVLTADLYIDASGPAARLLSRVAPTAPEGRRIAIMAGDAPAAVPDRPYRTVTPMAEGWCSETPLRDRTRRLVVHDPAHPPRAVPPDARSAQATLGQRDQAWVGNCVAIGHAAGVVEPVTPAPMMLLERDIERLLGLIPARRSMAMERREYNRRFTADRTHAALFDRALCLGRDFPDTPYWHAALSAPVPELLARKLDLFTRRGVLVAYDLEPFHPEDWAILHFGMGRRPARHDRLADRAALPGVRQFLENLRRGIGQAVAGLPDSATYRTRLEQYLRTRR